MPPRPCAGAWLPMPRASVRTGVDPVVAAVLVEVAADRLHLALDGVHAPGQVPVAVVEGADALAVSSELAAACRASSLPSRSVITSAV